MGLAVSVRDSSLELKTYEVFQTSRVIELMQAKIAQMNANDKLLDACCMQNVGSMQNLVMQNSRQQNNGIFEKSPFFFVCKIWWSCKIVGKISTGHAK